MFGSRKTPLDDDALDDDALDGDALDDDASDGDALDDDASDDDALDDDALDDDDLVAHPAETRRKRSVITRSFSGFPHIVRSLQNCSCPSFFWFKR
jgi:hypothetical protein